jgi:hypothetical protein
MQPRLEEAAMTNPEPTVVSTPPGDPQATGPHQPADHPSALVRILDQYLADLQAGRVPDRQQLLAEHPDLAGMLDSCLAALDFIHRAGHPTAGVPAMLGDFRIVREVGRGAMGVVYEAEQLSLKRRVALKVLRFGGPTDAEALQRFQREAQTVARLHHSNIVPVFAVGCEQGVHYFAMQFIDGHSLAAVAEHARQQHCPLDAREVARWGQQAAEALAYAHQRGVIHRDVKPSNLLLDPEGVLWLSDFGLARRLDEAALTATGVLLGTPRYMSPEQAAALRVPVDHRTDVYSLGATLYELATGRPVFDADTPQRVLAQIAEAEPVPPRRLRPDVPRDLETVLLKCLAKEPAQRYPSAQDLADDLRRFGNSEPIRARRTPMLTRLKRWAGKQRSGARAATLAVLTTLLLFGVAVFAWLSYRQGRIGQVHFTTWGPAARAEMFDAEGNLVLLPFTVPTEQPLALPGGWYRLTLKAPGRLSENYQILVEEGRQRTFTVGANDRALREPLPTSACVVVQFGARDTDIVEFVGGKWPRGEAPDLGKLRRSILLRRRSGRTGEVVWERSLTRKEHPAVADLGEGFWQALREMLFLSGDRLRFLRTAPDLDGDGVGDLVWAIEVPFAGLFPGFPKRPNGEALLCAISGATGRILWCHLTNSGAVEAKNAAGSPTRPEEVAGLVAALAGEPQAAPLTALIGVHRLCAPPTPFLPGDPLVVEDIDGDGCPDLIAVYAHRTPAPGSFKRGQRLRLWVEAISGRTGRVLWRYDGAEQSNQHLKDFTMGHEWDEVPDTCARLMVTGASKRRVLLAGLYKQIVRLNLHTGRPLGPSVSVPAPVSTWSADGRTALLERKPSSSSDRFVTAVAADSGAVRWTQLWDPLFRKHAPLLVDLDGSGLPVVVRPDGVLDGATGQPRWQVGDGRTPAEVVVGPDLDGDGCRDLFFAAIIDGKRFGRPKGTPMLLVEARSGKDGRAFWRRAEVLLDDVNTEWWPDHQRVEGLVYWQVSPHGPTWLAVAVAGQRDWQPFRQTYLFAPGTGRVEHIWPGVLAAGCADLDGDGLTDLYGHGADTFHAIRGITPEVWRRPGRWCPAWPGTGPDHEQFGPLCFTPPLPAGDLDGDGVADMLLYRPTTSFTGPKAPALEAYSGKTGRRLWEFTAPGSEEYYVTSCQLLHCVDLDGDGQPEVVFAYNKLSPWLVVLDGRTGRVRWVKNGYISPTYLIAQGPGDRLALVVVVKDPNNSKKEEFRVLDGATGRTLRSWPRTAGDPEKQPAIPWPGVLPREGLEPWRRRWRWGEDQRPRHEEVSRGFLSGSSGGPPEKLLGPHYHREDITYCRQPVPVGKPAEPLHHDFQGIDPRLSVPLPWVEGARQGSIPALGAGLVYLAVVSGFALARRWWLVAGLLVWVLVVPLIGVSSLDAPGLTRLPELSAEERQDWSGWYWLWPGRVSVWTGWGVLANPMVWAGAWFGLWVGYRLWRARAGRARG